METIRTISTEIEPQYVIEGAGVLLRRSIAPRASNEFDPFLLFDHFAFNDPIEGPILGFPMHPHRGIETVTYMLEGSTQHRDSLGNSGLIGPGDVQWMTSGRGILHEEMPRRGPNGAIYGFQLWVNLPAKLKMTTPRYQEVTAEKIPAYEDGGLKLRVVAGTSHGITGPVTQIAAAPVYLDAQLAPNTEFSQALPADHTVLAYVFEGEAEFGDKTVSAVRMLKFGPGDVVRVRTESSPVRFMLVSGQPFREPIAPYGPFVMNTREEIQQALNELRDGTFIREEAA
ncbi:MAG TPA: pirin family protein [Anaerolineales bacterium]